MTQEQRDAIRRSNQTRNLKCRACGQLGLSEQDGSKCGGMPGISYKVCGGCGNAQPITKRPRPEKLRKEGR
jgi:hypothetical protein